MLTPLTPLASAAPAVVVRRGDGLEAWHHAAVAVVDGTGRLTHALGDPQLVTFTRSAIKPLQALPLVMTGALDELGLGDDALALAASSHNGEDLHREGAARVLAALKLDASALQCGAHWPFGMRAAGRYPLAHEDEDPLRHNCSGKHAGFLALARALGADPGLYLAPDSPVQQLVKRAVAEVCEVDEGTLPVGIDGCSAPNYALPLAALARGFMKLATRGPAGEPPASLASPSDRAWDACLARVRGAMQRHPALVSGEGRFDWLMQTSFGARVVSKGGAEALQALGFRDPACGIVVKVLDGGERALAPLCLSVLQDLGLAPPAGLPRDLTEAWEARARPELRNYRGTLTGTLEVVAHLAPLR